MLHRHVRCCIVVRMHPSAAVVARPLPAPVPLATALWRAVADAGVRHVLGVPGDFSLGLLEALDDVDGVRWAGCSTELGAAHAADGHARAHGLGVACTTFGVGELTALGAAAGWAAEDVAVLHVVGGPTSRRLREGALVHHSLADGDALRWVRTAREAGAEVHVVAPEDPGAALVDALTTWRQGRRPTVLLVPQDLVDAPVAPPAVPPGPPRAGQEARDRARALLLRHVAGAPRCTLVLGHLAHRPRVRDAARELVRLGARVATLPAGRTAVDLDEPRLLGTYQGPLSEPGVREAVESGAGRVLLGCALTDTATAGFRHDLSAGRTLVVGRDALAVGDERVALPIEEAAEVLVEAWRAVAPDHRPARSTPRPEPVAPAPPAPPAPPRADPSSPVTQAGLWAAVEATLPPGHRVFVEPGTSTSAALAARLPRGTVLEQQTTWAALGFALPAALGASLAAPGQGVLAVVGDGGARVTVQELGLVRSAGARIVLLLVDNGGYTIERLLGRPGAPHHDVVPWDWAALLPALVGPDLVDVATPATDGEVEDALRAAFSARERAQVVVVRTDPLDAPPALHAVARAMAAARAGRPTGEAGAAGATGATGATAVAGGRA